ncbi:hypothetical protein JKJ11_24155 [Vibrio sp. SCSIO 43133]|uniref:hypothetical protein n=1 Tax=Vibrio sp. SCSIO 43133 TaxID=2802577 RepID=UPI0020757466|nr:hypothetical protein [Vibrio sp. SCSIO 43133]USE02741.1 hypothetical protein JKJ11_24155 [Vibrio sp. SCSIO 43133]
MKEVLANINWFDVAPSIMSAFATMAAAYAAIVSMQVSKRSNSIAKMTAIATHHNAASSKYFETVTELYRETKQLKELSYRLSSDWSSEIERYDNRKLGGVNPKPLRHVISDSCDTLSAYSMRAKNWGPYPSSAIFSVLKEGIEEMNDAEYMELLNKADGKYERFETTFGTPLTSEDISSAPAFRFACYQLSKRVSPDDWENIWKRAWCDDGRLTVYVNEYSRLMSILDKANNVLQVEKSKLAHTSFPLDVNPELCTKYRELLNIIDHLVTDNASDNLESYIEWPFKDEISRLVVCSIALANVTHKQIEQLYAKAYI